MYLLENTVRPYAWGSTTAIADLFGIEPSGGPEAELWIGAHPDSPSNVLLSAAVTEPLDRLIGAKPAELLGAACNDAFAGKLPFLMKVLAADSPLSLQVHPTVGQARDGFAREESGGPARDAPHRNYKDANHKPEMLYALSGFEALCGFRAPAEAADVLGGVESAIAADGGTIPALLTELIDGLGSQAPESERLRTAFNRLIEGGDEVADLVNTAATALAARSSARSGGNRAAQHSGNYARELDTAVDLARQYPGDPGVIISLLLNRLSLDPGESIYLPAGNIHAYLGGLGIEVMASSDNVLRGGLTPKHVDVDELMKTVSFEAAPAPGLQVETTTLGQLVYRPPFEEFQLQRIEIPAVSDSMAASDAAVAQNGPAVVLVVRGRMVLDSPHGDLSLGAGDSVFIPADEAPVMARLSNDDALNSGGALAFAVTVSTR
ncbi:mannose-6-phosphate isomerase, class I [Arthrobacter castelli]|uniref:mannose-6-phosphate isomerase, class I n=1 Tax=Arthrobacter castelli TaxID=271431 RepID=UPI0004007F1C|nr:mannose-6-phosphate isomerase, class I [Arthrobacter castelli]